MITKPVSVPISPSRNAEVDMIGRPKGSIYGWSGWLGSPETTLYPNAIALTSPGAEARREETHDHVLEGLFGTYSKRRPVARIPLKFI